MGFVREEYVSNVRVIQPDEYPITEHGHDPVCPQADGCKCSWVKGKCDDCFCQCEPIREGRRDERDRLNPAYYSADFHLGYQKGLDEAVKRVEKMLWVYGMSKEVVLSNIRGKDV